MTDATLVVGHDDLKAFILAVFDRWGTPPTVAELTADLMVRTDLRGVDSHGVGMLPTYLKWYRAGYIVPEPALEHVGAVLDGIIASVTPH